MKNRGKQGTREPIIAISKMKVLTVGMEIASEAFEPSPHSKKTLLQTIAF